MFDKIKEILKPIHNLTVPIVEKEINKVNNSKIVFLLLVLAILGSLIAIVAYATNGSNLNEIEKLKFSYDPADYLFDAGVNSLKVLAYVFGLAAAIYYSARNHFKSKAKFGTILYAQSTILILAVFWFHLENFLSGHIPGGFLLSLLVAIYSAYLSLTILKTAVKASYAGAIGVMIFTGVILSIILFLAFIGYGLFEVKIIRANSDFVSSYEVFNHSDSSFTVVYNDTIMDKQTKELRVMQVCEVRFPEGWVHIEDNGKDRYYHRYKKFYKIISSEQYNISFYDMPPYAPVDFSSRCFGGGDIAYTIPKKLVRICGGIERSGQDNFEYWITYIDPGKSGYEISYITSTNNTQDLYYILNNTNCYKKTDNSLITKLFLDR